MSTSDARSRREIFRLYSIIFSTAYRVWSTQNIMHNNCLLHCDCKCSVYVSVLADSHFTRDIKISGGLSSGNGRKLSEQNAGEIYAMYSAGRKTTPAYLYKTNRTFISSARRLTHAIAILNLSVSPSVAPVIHNWMVQFIEVCCVPHDRVMFLEWCFCSFEVEFRSPELRGSHRTRELNRSRPVLTITPLWFENGARWDIT